MKPLRLAVVVAVAVIMALGWAVMPPRFEPPLSAPTRQAGELQCAAGSHLEGTLCVCNPGRRQEGTVCR